MVNVVNGADEINRLEARKSRIEQFLRQYNLETGEKCQLLNEADGSIAYREGDNLELRVSPGERTIEVYYVKHFQKAKELALQEETVALSAKEEWKIETYFPKRFS